MFERQQCIPYTAAPHSRFHLYHVDVVHCPLHTVVCLALYGCECNAWKIIADVKQYTYSEVKYIFCYSIDHCIEIPHLFTWSTDLNRRHIVMFHNLITHVVQRFGLIFSFLLFCFVSIKIRSQCQTSCLRSSGVLFGFVEFYARNTREELQGMTAWNTERFKEIYIQRILWLELVW